MNKKSEDEKREIELKVRVNKKELQVILEKSKKYKTTQAKYIRETAIGKDFELDEYTRETRRILQNLGNNVNQIAKRLNENEFMQLNVRELHKAIITAIERLR